ncbi:MAG: hypothetical protein AAF366_15185 [Pseudomonadota bacterium]
MRFALPFLLLTACAQLPPEAATLPRPAPDLPFPRLVPLSPLLAETQVPPRAQPAGDALRARGAALARRAIAPPVTGDLAARGDRLRQRAAELRAAEI